MSLAGSIARSMTLGRVVDLTVTLGLLGAAFFAVAASDIHAGYSQLLWYWMTLGFGVGCLLLAWMHRADSFNALPTAALLAAHWLATLLAVRGVFYFVETGQFTDSNAGLANGIVFALSTLLCGVHVQPRIAIIGLAMGAAVAIQALIKDNIWLLIAVGAGALALVSLFQSGSKSASAQPALGQSDAGTPAPGMTH
jgi:hypothetical protein